MFIRICRAPVSGEGPDFNKIEWCPGLAPLRQKTQVVSNDTKTQWNAVQ